MEAQKKDKMAELLAPAGNRERLDAAFRYGADAVYCGGKRLGLRAFSENFDMEELAEAAADCHTQDKKIYFTLNAYLKQGDLHDLPSYVRDVWATGVDAFIVSDPGALSIIKETIPEAELHISTQANVLNAAAARFWQTAGASRIILARECSLKDIREIRAAVGDKLELETFVHGAMCVSYSGRCLLSSILDGRDGNQGACSQPCRRNFTLMERGGDGECYPIEEDGNGTYILNSRDMNMIRHIRTLLDAGVSSFKIEGRMKTVFYVSTIVNAYRMALDAAIYGEPFQEEWFRETEKVRHRPYCHGFYFADSEKKEPRETQWENANPQSYDFVGVILEEDGQGECVAVEQRNRFFAGDVLECLSPGRPGWSFKVKGIFDENGNEQDSAPHPQQRLFLETDAQQGAGFGKGDLLRKEREEPLH